MARVVAVFDDLLLGSNVQGMLAAGGHDTTLAPPMSADPAGSDVLIVDVGQDGFDAVGLVARLRASGALDGVSVLGIYSHVHVEQRQAAEAAGFDLVVPRSRLMREGAALVERLASGR